MMNRIELSPEEYQRVIQSPQKALEELFDFQLHKRRFWTFHVRCYFHIILNHISHIKHLHRWGLIECQLAFTALLNVLDKIDNQTYASYDSDITCLHILESFIKYGNKLDEEMKDKMQPFFYNWMMTLAQPFRYYYEVGKKIDKKIQGLYDELRFFR